MRRLEYRPGQTQFTFCVEFEGLNVICRRIGAFEHGAGEGHGQIRIRRQSPGVRRAGAF